MRRALLLGALLVGCGQPTAAPPTLTGLLPNPAMPGQTVTAYGTLPPALHLTLDGQPISGTRTAAGVTIVLPATMLAGRHHLTLSDDPPLAGDLTVVPLISAVRVQGTQVRVTGAGWDADAGVEINGLPQAAARVQAAPGVLEVSLGAPPAYGTLRVRVTEHGQTSAPVGLTRAAVTVTGRLLAPPGPLRAAGAAPLPAFTALLVRGGAPAPDVLRAQALPGLGWTKLSYPDAASAWTALRALVAQGRTVEADWPVRADGLDRQAVPAGATQWFWTPERFAPAWTATRGAGVTVAVVDSGVALQHPDLAGTLLPGRDFVDGDHDPQDMNGHGTHVAGLIAAHGQVTGAAPDARLLPVRVLDARGDGDVATLTRGLLWAAGLLPDDPNPHPAQVVNLSLGVGEPSAALQDAVAQLQAHGVLVVAATGNDGGAPEYPAALPGVLAVTALAGPRVPYQPAYANRGPGTQLSAFGGDPAQDQDGDGVPDEILSTDVVNGQPGYGLRAGTSMAAPQVSGAAALLLAAGYPATTVAGALRGRALDLGVPGFDDDSGAGLVQADPASAPPPRTYVLALDGTGRVRSWTVAQGGAFRLASVPPDEALTLVAATDADGDGVVGQPGEAWSSTPLPPGAPGSTVTQDLVLGVGAGAHPIVLGGTL